MIRRVLLLVCLSFLSLTGYGQDVPECPQNLGFEEGSFNHWQASTSSILGDGTFAPFIPGVVPGRHTLIKRGTERDPWGGFSLNSPNGSEYVVRLGNKDNGSQAERLSYTINVPANAVSYAVSFNYAVVFQNPLDHAPNEQPQFSVLTYDETANTVEECYSFDFEADRGLPDFIIVPTDSVVLYKPWTQVIINLARYAGHTVRLEFTTNDCSRVFHFGYAYIDFNENCSNPIAGSIVCPESASITLRSFPGFAQYRWYNATTMETYGTSENLYLSPTPPVGTKIAIELVPFPNAGRCTETIYTVIKNMEDIQVVNLIRSCTSVDLTSKSLVGGNIPGITYSYFLDPQGLIPIPNPRHITVSGTYYIMGRLLPTVCFSIRPVVINIAPLPPIDINPPRAVDYPGTVDLTKTFVPLDDMEYSYWIDRDATRALPDPDKISKAGTYYIKAVDSRGCVVVTPVRADIIVPDIVIPNTFTPNGDGINDVLTILIDSRIRIKYFKVYNRWGQQVYETSDINNYWNGFRGSSSPLPGVYYWVLEGNENSRKYLRYGSVTVIR